MPRGGWPSSLAPCIRPTLDPALRRPYDASPSVLTAARSIILARGYPCDITMA